MRKKTACLWKRELCIFASVFIALGAAALLSRFILKQRYIFPPRFFGMQNYWRLLFNDSMLPRFIWNTLWPSLAAGAVTLAILIAVKWGLRSRSPKMTEGWWDLLVYGLVFISCAAAPPLFTLVTRQPAAEEAADIIAGHMLDFAQLRSPLLSFDSSIRTAWLAWSIAWLLWGLVKGLSAILYRKREKSHG